MPIHSPAFAACFWWRNPMKSCGLVAFPGAVRLRLRDSDKYCDSASPVPPSDARTDADRCGSRRQLLFVRNRQLENGCACIRTVRLAGVGLGDRGCTAEPHASRHHERYFGHYHPRCVPVTRHCQQTVVDRGCDLSLAGAGRAGGAMTPLVRVCLFTSIRTLCRQSTDGPDREVEPPARGVWVHFDI